MAIGFNQRWYAISGAYCALDLAVGLGWNPRATDGQAFDLDAVAFWNNEAGKVRSDADFIFFNNLKSSEGAIEHTGDNRTGDGIDETIKVDLTKVPSDVNKWCFVR